MVKLDYTIESPQERKKIVEEILKEKKEKYIKTSIQGLIEITKKELNVKI